MASKGFYFHAQSATKCEPKVKQVYLFQEIDGHLPPLSPLAEIHGGSDQQEVSDPVTVHIHRVDFTSIIGTDLEKSSEDRLTHMWKKCSGCCVFLHVQRLPRNSWHLE